MATAKKSTTTKTAANAKAARPAAKAPKAAKTAKPAAKAEKNAKAPKAAAPAPAAKPGAKLAAGPLKPIKDSFNKTGLITHLAELATVEVRAVKAVMAALEATITAALHKKGLGQFTLPGLLKVTAVQVPAKKKRTGIDPFTKQERVFAAKPASVKVKVRALKKLKDAAA